MVQNRPDHFTACIIKSKDITTDYKTNNRKDENRRLIM